MTCKDPYKPSNSPGPGMYNIVTPLSGRYSLIGTSDHLNNQDVLYQTSLGPGQYNLNLEIGGPKYTMGKIIKLKSNEVKKGIIYFIQEFDYLPQTTLGFIPKYLIKDIKLTQ